MIDQYLANPALLKGQPKKTIADYVEQNGILVPRRFESLEEARQSGLPIIARSEHPQDYDGASGLFLSPRFPEHDHAFRWDEDFNEFFDSVLDYKRDSSEGEGDSKVKIKEFCKILQINYDKFVGQLDYSFWEMIHGTEVNITADSAIKDRYHITTRTRNTGSIYHWLHTFSTVEDKSLVRHGHISLLETGLSLRIINNFDAIINLYEKIRGLDRFNSNHCPTMEFLAADDNDKITNYFLQYHRTRDFKAADFELERFSPLGTAEFRDVRGSTLKGGIECKVVILYAADVALEDNFGPGKKWSWCVPDQEEGAIEAPITYKLMDEIMSKRRNLQILETHFPSFASGHELRSLWVKPKISIVSHREIVNTLYLSDNEMSDAFEKARETGENQYINLHVECDGRKAFVKRI